VRSFGVLFGLGLGVFLPLSMLQDLYGPTPGHVPGPSELLGFLAVLAPFSLAGPLLSCALTQVLAQDLRERPTGVGEAFRAVRERGPAVLGTAIVSMLILTAGFLLLVIPGIYLSFTFMVVYQVVTLEGKSGIGALQRSWELMRGSWWRGFRLMTLVGLGLGVASISLALVWSLVPALRTLGEASLQAIAYAYTTAVLVLLYDDLRARADEDAAAVSEAPGG